MTDNMTAQEASTEPLTGELLDNGRYIVVEFDEDGPCTWMSGEPIAVRR